MLPELTLSRTKSANQSESVLIPLLEGLDTSRSLLILKVLSKTMKAQTITLKTSEGHSIAPTVAYPKQQLFCFFVNPYSEKEKFSVVLPADFKKNNPSKQLIHVTHKISIASIIEGKAGQEYLLSGSDIMALSYQYSSRGLRLLNLMLTRTPISALIEKLSTNEVLNTIYPLLLLPDQTYETKMLVTMLLPDITQGINSSSVSEMKSMAYLKVSYEMDKLKHF